jgi:DNA-binding transcriptional regulator YiaG
LQDQLDSLKVCGVNASDDVVIAHMALPSAADCKAIRLAAGLSQAALAERVGTTAATICRWEASRRRPRGPMVVAYFNQLMTLVQMRKAIERWRSDDAGDS